MRDIRCRTFGSVSQRDVRFHAAAVLERSEMQRSQVGLAAESVGTSRATPSFVSARRRIAAVVTSIACMCGGLTHASENPPRTNAAVRFKVGAGVGGGVDDPLNDLRRNSLALGVALRRRVPDWSPESDVLKGRVDAILAATLDYEEIARRSLGTDWNRLTSAQRREFLERFSALTNQTFVTAMTRPEVHLRFDSETVMGPLASVVVTAWSSKLTPNDEQHMEYRLAKKGDCWRVYDVLVDHVSLVEGYRDQFARLMRRGGFPEIIVRMRRKQELAGRYSGR